MSAPQAAQGRCTHARRLQRSTSTPPSTTNSTNPKCSATTVSASARYAAGERVTGGARGAVTSPPRQHEPAELRVGERLDAAADQPPAALHMRMNPGRDERFRPELVICSFAPSAQTLEAIVDADEVRVTLPQRIQDRSMCTGSRHRPRSLRALDALLDREQHRVIGPVERSPEECLLVTPSISSQQASA